MQLLPRRARGAAQAQTPLGRSSERSVRLAKAWQRVAGSALKAVHQRMHRREMALGKCITGPSGIAQRAGSPVGPPRSTHAFPRSVVAGATIPSIICSFVLPECMVVGKYLPLYTSFTGQHNPEGFVSVSTPLISKMRTFFKNRPPWFKLF